MRREIMWLPILILTVTIVISQVGGFKTNSDWRRELWPIRREFLHKDPEGLPRTVHIKANMTNLSVTVGLTEVHSEVFSAKLNDEGNLEEPGFVQIIVADSSTFKIMASRKFLTSKPSEERSLVSFVKGLQPGRIVVVIGLPHFTIFLNSDNKGERAMSYLGSEVVSSLALEDIWLLISVTSEVDEPDIPGYFKLKTPIKNDVHSNHLNIPKHDKNEDAKVENVLMKAFYSSTVLKKHSFSERPQKVISTTTYLDLIDSFESDAPHYEAKVMMESVLQREGTSRKYGSLEVTSTIPLSPRKRRCFWHQDVGEREMQTQFCRSYEGYSILCNCYHYFNPKAIISPPLNINQTIPLLIVTANKPHHLFRLLNSLGSVYGASQSPVLIVIDGYHRETIDLVRVFQLDFRIHRPQGEPWAFTRTNMNIGFALWTAFDFFKEANKIILLEDDLLLSPDLLSFFHQTSFLLDEDPTISHINAFSINSFPLTAGDIRKVIRVQIYPMYGWMTSRRWAEFALSYWVREGPNRDWDWWLFLEDLKRGTDAIVPEVSRTGHGGSAGAHVTGFVQHVDYSGRIQAIVPPVPLDDLERLKSKSYQDWITKEIKEAVYINPDPEPCHYPLFNASNDNTSLAILVALKSRSDKMKNMFLLQFCLGTDSSELRELYNGVLRLNVKPVTDKDVNTTLTSSDDKYRRVLYIIGCPLSKYCALGKGQAWVMFSKRYIAGTDKLQDRRSKPLKRTTRQRYRSTLNATILHKNLIEYSDTFLL